MTLTDKKIEHLVQRIESQSRRIRKLNHHLSNIENYRKSYERHRLKGVIKREKVKYSFAQAVSKAIKLLGSVRKNFRLNSASKGRHLGLFTNSEMRRLRKFLAEDHKNEYFLYRFKNYSVNKNKSLLLLTNQEKQRLKYALKLRIPKKKDRHTLQLSQNEKIRLRRLLKNSKYSRKGA